MRVAQRRSSPGSSEKETVPSIMTYEYGGVWSSTAIDTLGSRFMFLYFTDCSPVVNTSASPSRSYHMGTTCVRPSLLTVASLPALVPMRRNSLYSALVISFNSDSPFACLFLPLCDHLDDVLPRSPAVGFPPADRSFEGYMVEEVSLEELGEHLILRDMEVGKLPPFLLRIADYPACYLVRIPEGHTFTRKIVRDVGRRYKTLCKGPFHVFVLERDIFQHGPQHIERGFDRVPGIEHRLLVLLHVPVIGEGEAFHYRQDGYEVAVDPARLPANELGHVGVPFLGHDARSGGELVPEIDEIEFLCRPEYEFFRYPAQVHHQIG